MWRSRRVGRRSWRGRRTRRSLPLGAPARAWWWPAGPRPAPASAPHRELSLRQQGAHFTRSRPRPAAKLWPSGRSFGRLLGPSASTPCVCPVRSGSRAGRGGAPVALSDTQRRFTSKVSRPRSAAHGAPGRAAAERGGTGRLGACERRHHHLLPAHRGGGPAGGRRVRSRRAADRGDGTRLRSPARREGLGALGRTRMERLRAPALRALGDKRLRPPLSVPGLLASSARRRWRSRPMAPRRLSRAFRWPRAPRASPSAGCTRSRASRSAGGAFEGPTTHSRRHPAEGARGRGACGLPCGPRLGAAATSAIEEGEPGGCNFVGSKPLEADGAPGSRPRTGRERVRLAGRRSLAHAAADPDGMAVLAWIEGNERVRVARADGGSLGRDRYPDIVAPRLRRLRLEPRSVRPAGQQLSFRLSERARIVRISRRGRQAGSFRALRRRGAASMLLRAPVRRGASTSSRSARAIAAGTRPRRPHSRPSRVR